MQFVERRRADIAGRGVQNRTKKELRHASLPSILRAMIKLVGYVCLLIVMFFFMTQCVWPLFWIVVTR